jgi:hypothetical protein
VLLLIRHRPVLSLQVVRRKTGVGMAAARVTALRAGSTAAQRGARGSVQRHGMAGRAARSASSGVVDQRHDLAVAAHAAVEVSCG